MCTKGYTSVFCYYTKINNIPSNTHTHTHQSGNTPRTQDKQLISRTSNTLAATVRISTIEPLRVDVITPAPLLLTAIVYSHVLGLPQTYFHTTHTQVQHFSHEAVQTRPDQTGPDINRICQRAPSCPRKDFTLLARIKEHDDFINCLTIAWYGMISAA